jgi:hypothetical protein
LKVQHDSYQDTGSRIDPTSRLILSRSTNGRDLSGKRVNARHRRTTTRV